MPPDLLPTPEEFRTLLRLERSRADRAGSPLSLLVLDVSKVAWEMRDPADACLAMRRRLRAIDVLGRFDSRSLGVLLPETDAQGANRLLVELDRMLERGAGPFPWKLFTHPDEPRDDRRDPPRPDRGHRRRRAHRNGREVEAAAGDGAGESRPGPHHAPQHGSVRAGGERTPRPGAEPQPLRTLFLESRDGLTRAIDVVGALVGLALASPVLLAAAAAIKLTSRGPILFRQQRCGLGGRPFEFIKLRTMYVDAEERKRDLLAFNEQTGPVFKMKRDPRITPVGRILRKTSIDEMPQLWNVLKGDMSLVGPRPPIPAEVADYAPWHLRRLEVTGGLTCFWQVNGRSDIQFEDWVRMDLRYADRRSTWLDLRLLARTLPAVLSCRGAR